MTIRQSASSKGRQGGRDVHDSPKANESPSPTSAQGGSGFPAQRSTTFRQNMTTSGSCSGTLSSTRVTTREPGLTKNARPSYSSARRTSKNSSKPTRSVDLNRGRNRPARLASVCRGRPRRHRRSEVDAELLGDASQPRRQPSERLEEGDQILLTRLAKSQPVRGQAAFQGRKACFVAAERKRRNQPLDPRRAIGEIQLGTRSLSAPISPVSPLLEESLPRVAILGSERRSRIAAARFLRIACPL